MLMSRQVILFLTTLLAAATVLNFMKGQQAFKAEQSQHLTADTKVLVELYSESLCPDCLQFIRTSLKAAAATTDFWKICDFMIYPYGNGRWTTNGTQWSFTCQHGARECEGNLIEQCAIKKYDFYTQALPFTICLQENTADWTSQGKKCASNYNMDWNVISSCAYGSEGNTYMHEVAVKTDSLVPKHTYVPWIVVNGQHSTGAENAVQLNMVRYVCSIYTGSVKIDACK